MPTRTQKTFYRYLSFEVKTLDLLCHDSLYFANPSNFNDPLDCKPHLEPDSAREDLRALLAHLVKQRVSAEILDSLTKAKIRREGAEPHSQKRANLEASRVLREIAYHATNPEFTVSEEQAETNLLTQSVHQELSHHYERGVCCFSSTYNNPLLWSHYGNEHRGICIGYDLIREPRPVLHKVNYGGSRFIKTSTLVAALLRDDKDARANLDRDMLLRKARSWSYEREWRLIGKQGIQDSPLRLKEVTFGLRCPASVMHAVVKALQARHQPVKFFEIYEVPGSYRLARRETDLNELNVYLPKTAMSPQEMFGSVED